MHVSVFYHVTVGLTDPVHPSAGQRGVVSQPVPHAQTAQHRPAAWPQGADRRVAIPGGLAGTQEPDADQVYLSISLYLSPSLSLSRSLSNPSFL